MANPMPCAAPVTSAMRLSKRPMRSPPFRLRAARALFEALGVLHVEQLPVPVHPLGEAAQDRSRSHLDERVHALLLEKSEGLPPAHGGVHLGRELASRASAAVEVGRASTLATTGQAGSEKGRAARTGVRFSRAGAMSAQWNGALTGRGMARLQPRVLAISMARWTASACPAMTTCPGALSLAGTTTCPCAASAQTAARGSGSMPMRAAMAPTPTGTATCMNCRACGPCARRPRRTGYRRPRGRCTRRASVRRGRPGRGRAWPACRTRQAATETVSTPGWVLAVRFRSASGPSHRSSWKGSPERGVGLVEDRRGPRGSAPRGPCPCPRTAMPDRGIRQQSSSGCSIDHRMDSLLCS